MRVDSPREVAANMVRTLLGRNEGKELVDLQALLATGLDLRDEAVADAKRKDAGVDPATLAWVLETGPDAAVTGVPGGYSTDDVDRIRHDLARAFRTLAFELSRKE